MEENPLAKQVADELKGLLTASVKCIKDGDHQTAFNYLNQALSVTELIEYHDGSAMILHNLANLYAAVGDNIEALKTAALADEKARTADPNNLEYKKLIHNLFLIVQKEGLQFVKDREHEKALLCFETALPFAPESKKDALHKQIGLLRRIIDERE